MTRRCGFGCIRRSRPPALCLVCEIVGLAVVAPVRYTLAPTWARLVVIVGALVGLARLGRPVDRPILRPAMVAARFRRINPDIVLRAY